jgi:hypothetical protein
MAIWWAYIYELRLFLVLLQKQVFYSSTSNLVKKGKVWEENNEKCKKMIFQEGIDLLSHVLYLVVILECIYIPYITCIYGAEYFWFGPVLDQNKQPNWFYFFLVLEPNRTENQFKPINFSLVRIWFFSFQTGSNRNYSGCVLYTSVLPTKNRVADLLCALFVVVLSMKEKSWRTMLSYEIVQLISKQVIYVGDNLCIVLFVFFILKVFLKNLKFKLIFFYIFRSFWCADVKNNF